MRRGHRRHEAPLRKTVKNQAPAEALYTTGNCDAMYLAGMVAEPKAMGVGPFWPPDKDGLSSMLSGFVAAVTLPEAGCAQSVAEAEAAAPASFTGRPCWLRCERLSGWRPCWPLRRRRFARSQGRCAAPCTMSSWPWGRYLPLHGAAVAAARQMGPVLLPAARGKGAGVSRAGHPKGPGPGPAGL